MSHKHLHTLEAIFRDPPPSNKPNVCKSKPAS